MDTSSKYEIFESSNPESINCTKVGGSLCKKWKGNFRIHFRNVERICDLALYLHEHIQFSITPHISTCARSKDHENFAIFHRENATDISTYTYVEPSL